MTVPITRADVNYALQPSPWDLGNEVLYALCRDYPRHDREDAIIAKVWLIGRSYAAAIERRRDPRESSDDFYDKVVARKLRESRLDQWLSSLPDRMADPWRQLGQVVAVHKRLIDLFAVITDLEKRSLASKYLHFPRPDLFFLYDSRATAGARNAVPLLGRIPRVQAAEADPEYLKLVRRCQWIADEVAERFDTVLTPRQVDKILLRMAPRTRSTPDAPRV